MIIIGWESIHIAILYGYPWVFSGHLL